MHYPLSRQYCYRGQRGAALVIAMLIFALCTALIVAMKNEFTLFYQRGANVFHAEQAYAYLLGAEDLASLALVLDYDTDKDREQPRDDLEEFWAQPATPYTLDEGGWLMGSLQDLQGRFNLNSLEGIPNQNDGEASFTTSQQQFIRLLQALPELDLSRRDAVFITRSIGDWLDPDGNASVDGAEDDFYFSQTPSYRAANSIMASVSELRAVAHVTPEIFAALEPWVSVLPPAVVTLNIHTAPAILLRTINDDNNLDPLGEADVETLLEQRQDPGFKDVEEFLNHPVFAGKTMVETRKKLGESSAFFLLAAEAEVAERRVRLYSVLERKGRAVNIVARASGSL